MLRKISILASALGLFLMSHAAFAEGDMTEQDPIVVNVNLGIDGSDKHVFEPSKLTFETGKLYRLVLHNPSNIKHYFTSIGLSQKVHTRKVQVMDDLGEGAKAISEIKGMIREIEVYPGGTAEWWFVPVSTGTLDDLHCHIKDQDGKTHAEKGMTGTIVIK